jgi:penicillin-binding protein 2
VQVGKAGAPIGKPRVASELPWPIVSGASPATAP